MLDTVRTHPKGRYLALAWRTRGNAPAEEVIGNFDDVDQARNALDRLRPDLQAWQIFDEMHERLVDIYIRR